MTWREMFDAIPNSQKDTDVSIFVDNEYASFAGISTSKAIMYAGQWNDAPLDDGHPFINLSAVEEKCQQDLEENLKVRILAKAQEQGITPKESIKIIKLIMAETGMRLKDACVWGKKNLADAGYLVKLNIH